MRHFKRSGNRTGPSMTIQDSHGRLLAIPREPEPSEVAVLGICLLYGVIGSVWYEQVASAAVRSYPGIGGRTFVAGLAVGGVTALYGLAQPTLRGMRLERAGLWLLVSLCLAFTAWSPFATTARGIGLMIYMGILVTVPSFFVARRRGRQIRAVEYALRARPEVPHADA